MDIKKILNEEVIYVNQSIHSKEDALDFLAYRLLEHGYIKEVKDFLDDIYARERQGTTGIGNYIAIPHGISQYVTHSTVGILTLTDEVEWEKLDDNGIKVIIMFVVEDKSESENEPLKMLATVASKLAHEEVRKKILVAQTAEDVIKAFIEE